MTHLASELEYLTHEERTTLLHELAEAMPSLMSVRSIGKSYEGRDIWAVALTNVETGAADAKPALYVDANMHAMEIIGSAVCIFTIKKVLDEYGSDTNITRLMDSFALLVVPCVNPDGAEHFLSSPEMTIHTRAKPLSCRRFDWQDRPPGRSQGCRHQTQVVTRRRLHRFRDARGREDTLHTMHLGLVSAAGGEVVTSPAKEFQRAVQQCPVSNTWALRLGGIGSLKPTRERAAALHVQIARLRSS